MRTADLTVGDVVIGPFVSNGTTLTDHRSVVYGVFPHEGRAYAALVYTTSMKEEDFGVQFQFGRQFEAIEKKMAGWSKDCRFDASKVSVVPVERLKKTGTIPRSCVASIEHCMSRAESQKALNWEWFSTKLPQKRTGN